MARVIVFGTGQQASLAHCFLRHDSPHEVVAFTVDREYLTASRFLDLPVVPFDEVEQSFPPPAFEMFVLTNFRRMNHYRADRFAQAKSKGYRCTSYVSPRAMTFPNLVVGENCCITRGNQIDPYVEIGDNVILWSSNHVGHHSRIGDHTFIASNVTISGGVAIEPYCVLGVGATIRDGVTIAREGLIGAGTLIMRDTKPFEVYKGAASRAADIRSDEIGDRALSRVSGPRDGVPAVGGS